MRPSVLRIGNQPPQRATLHLCRQPSCPGAAFALVIFAPTQVRSPDRAVLARVATEQIPGGNELGELVAAARGDGALNRVVGSRVATFLGRPGLSVEIERRRDAGSPTFYQAGGFAFAGNLMISVQSFSTDRAAARRNRDLIFERMQVQEGPRVEEAGGGAAAAIAAAAPADPSLRPPAPRL